MKCERLIVLFVIVLILAGGCGSNNDPAPAQTTSPASTYLVEYLPGMMSASEGKTEFQLRIRKRSDSSPATGLAVTLLPMMSMTGGMSHATPVDVVTESAAQGTYDCTVYYLMASGAGMGYWELKVRIGTETATFYPSVAMAMMGADTTKRTLYGPSDIVSGMSGTTYNYYYLFNDGMVSAASPTFRLYVSHAQDSKMTFKPLSTVSSPTGTVSSALVSASTDSSFTTEVITATDAGNGHWSMTGITPLASAGTHTVYVKLQVNGQDKTTNGTAASGTNAYQAFTVTSH